MVEVVEAYHLDLAQLLVEVEVEVAHQVEAEGEGLVYFVPLEVANCLHQKNWSSLILH